MKKITILTMIAILLSSISYAQETYKRITINNVNQNIYQKLVDNGIDISCGTIHKKDKVTLELSEYELSLLDKNNIPYTTDIEDLTKFYQNRIEKTLSQALINLEIEKSITQALRASQSNTTIDNFLEYTGCNEVDWSTPVNFNLGSMGGCLTLSETLSELDDMRTLFPSLISAKMDASPTNQTTYGNTQGTESWVGKTIYYVRITGDQSSAEGTKPQILYTSMIHSREVSSLMSNIYFMWYLLENYATDSAVKNLVDNNELYFIPVANPDGLRWNEHVAPNGGALQRKNLRPNTGGTGNTSTNRGVDLNRNFDYFFGSAGSGSSGTPTSDSYRGPSAFSEPESQILRDFVLARNFQTVTMNHSFANAIPHPYGGNPTFVSGREDEMHKWHEDMTKYNRYVSGATIFSAANGIADDWMVGGAIDGNGSTGSGQNILATTPEHGDSGFWPAPTEIVPIAKRAMRIYFINAMHGGKYAKFHDLTQSNINALTSNLTFGIERLGQTVSNFTLTVTPISSNISSITSPATQTGMNILEQRNVTAQLVLNAGIQPNDKIEYRVQLSNGDGIIFYDVNMKKYYQPNVLLSDNPDTDLLTNWVTSGTWTASNATNTQYSGTRAIKQGGNSISPYSNNVSSTLTTASSYDFSNANEILIQFYTKWDLERNFDFVEIQGSTNGSTWQALCGKYNKPNATNSTNSSHSGKSSTSHSFQANNSTGQVYDGDQMDKWVMEEIVIDATNNSFLLGATTAQFRFRFRTDSNNVSENYSTTSDGFFIDDFKIIEVQIPCDASIPPTGLATNSITTISASVNWNNIPSTTYDIRYRTIGAPSWTTVTDIATNSYIINGLTSATDYEIQVATRCTSTTSSYSSSVNFTTATSVACTGNSVNSFPYTESFESGLGLWTQGVNNSEDDIDWTENSGSTPSTNTGPSATSNGSQYIYTETSTNVTPAGSPNKIAYLISPCFEFNGFQNSKIEFDYHMYGADIGTLNLEASIDNGATYTSIFSLSGEQQTSNAEAWVTQTVNLSLYDGQTIKLRFSALSGASFNGDIAIDQIILTADTNTLSISESDFDLNGLIVYPNPFNNSINIKLPSQYSSNNIDVELFDITGRLILKLDSINPKNNLLKLSNINQLSNGPYFIKIVDNVTNTSVVKRLIKQ